MRKKQFYEAPDAELLVVRFEGNFCGTFDPNGTEKSTVKDDLFGDGWNDENN